MNFNGQRITLISKKTQGKSQTSADNVTIKGNEIRGKLKIDHPNLQKLSINSNIARTYSLDCQGKNRPT